LSSNTSKFSKINHPLKLLGAMYWRKNLFMQRIIFCTSSYAMPPEARDNIVYADS
jgi:hypothetical protein